MLIQKVIVAYLVFLNIESAAYVSKIPRYSTRRPSQRQPVDFVRCRADGDSAFDESVSRPYPEPSMSRSSFFTTIALAVAFSIPAYSASADTDNHIPVDSCSFPSDETNNKDRNDIRSENLPTLEIASEANSVQESISGFVAGGALAAAKTLVKYPLDTVTVRLQMPASEYSIAELGRLFGGSYNGVTLSLISNIPGGAVFFAVKDAAKASLKTAAWTGGSPTWLTTTMAVGAALIPYWVVRNPSEVIKVRQQAGTPGYGDGVSAWDAIQLTLNETKTSGGSLIDGIGNLYTGYWENVIYGLPSDVIKFVAYEALTGGRKDLSALEGAQAGALATAASQLITTPLDVIRNRLMTGADSAGRFTSTEGDGEVAKKNYVQSLITLGREEGLRGLFAGATPRVAKAILSGAIQFATYEETKQSIARMLQQRR